jgi:hypothetical protein
VAVVADCYEAGLLRVLDSLLEHVGENLRFLIEVVNDDFVEKHVVFPIDLDDRVVDEYLPLGLLSLVSKVSVK